MALLLRNGAIFLHVPKTGGLWVTEVLKDQGLIKRPIGHIHADLHQVLYLLDPKFVFTQTLLARIKGHIPVSVKRKFNPYKKMNQAIWQGDLPDEDRSPFVFLFCPAPVQLVRINLEIYVST